MSTHETYEEWEERTRPARSRALWRSPGEIAQVAVVAAFWAVNSLGVVVLPLIVMGVLSRVVTPLMIERGLPLGRALWSSATGTLALAAALALSLPGARGYALAALFVMTDWRVDPSVLRWLWGRWRRG